MQRRMLVGLAVGGCLVLGLGLMVWAGTQGLFSPHGRTQRLLTMADQALQQGQLPMAQAKLEELIASSPDAPVADQALLKLGEVYEGQQQLTLARNTYHGLLEKYPNSALVPEAQARLGKINVALLFSPHITDEDAVYTVQPGDTLGGIARTNGTTIDLIKKTNELTGNVIRIGQRLKMPKGHFAIAVDKSENRLVVTADNQFFKLYPVSTGANNSTPVGTFKIVNKIVDPVWYKQGAAVAPDSPANILGTRWLGLDKPGYGIHGTIEPDAVGKQVTAGCVRMINTDVEELFTIVPVGTEVTIVD